MKLTDQEVKDILAKAEQDAAAATAKYLSDIGGRHLSMRICMGAH